VEAQVLALCRRAVQADSTRSTFEVPHCGQEGVSPLPARLIKTSNT
jgi:hypothetical protein